MTAPVRKLADARGADGEPAAIAVYQDGDRLLADCPSCNNSAGRALRRRDGLVRFGPCFGCGHESVYREEGEPNAAAPAAALASARVDLIDLIENGIPEREFVPGCEPWLIRGKRYLIPAAAGTGKSLGALTIAVEIVTHGGTVAILDVENGAEEYATRLQDILADRDQLAEACRDRLHYFAWPALSLTWSPEDWTAAIGNADLIVFDSSRMVLSSVGLAEDSNDDYSQFVTTLLIPLARVGKTTLVLDNTGHEDQRARGASAKADLNEVVYLAKAGKPFDREQAGELHLHRTRTRFSGLPERLTMTLGGGTYRAPVIADRAGDDTFRPTVLMQRVSRAVAEHPGLSKRALREAVPGKNQTKDLALELLVVEEYVDRRREGNADHHYPLQPFTEDPDRAPVPRPCPDRAPARSEGDRAPVPLPEGVARDKARSHRHAKTAERAPADKAGT